VASHADIAALSSESVTRLSARQTPQGETFSEAFGDGERSHAADAATDATVNGPRTVE